MSTCPTHEQLSRLALGTLPPDQIDWIASHIDRCGTCEREMDRLDAREDALLANLRSGGAASSSHAAAVTPGTALGDYVIEEAIGAGGMGQVFRASHRRMKRDVALKILM